MCATSNCRPRAARLGHRAIDAADRHSLAGVVRAQVAPEQAGLPLAVDARLDARDGASLLTAFVPFLAVIMLGVWLCSTRSLWADRRRVLPNPARSIAPIIDRIDLAGSSSWRGS